jgi:hypothetical protein
VEQFQTLHVDGTLDGAMHWELPECLTKWREEHL